jgi:phage shock protein A
LISILKPGERRLLSYAADPSVHIKIEHGSKKREDDNNDEDEEATVDTVTHLRILHGTMILTRQQQRTNTYIIRNADTAPRDVVIEHPAGSGWKLADGLKPEESTTSFSRFRVKVAAAATEKLTIRELRPAENTYALTDLNTNYLELFAGGHPNPEVQSALQQVLEQKTKISSLDSQISSREQQISSITTDQSRVRENMKALRGSAEEKVLLQRYAQQLNSQEDQMAALNTQVTELKQRRDSERSALDTMSKKINLDQTF